MQGMTNVQAALIAAASQVPATENGLQCIMLPSGGEKTGTYQSVTKLVASEYEAYLEERDEAERELRRAAGSKYLQDQHEDREPE